MSGGSWNYLCDKVSSAAIDLQRSHCSEERREFGRHLELVAKALHDIEWVDSVDYKKGDELEAIRKVIPESIKEVRKRLAEKEQAEMIRLVEKYGYDSLPAFLRENQ